MERGQNSHCFTLHHPPELIWLQHWQPSPKIPDNVARREMNEDSCRDTGREKKRRERDNRSAAAGWEENGLHAQVHQQFNFQIALWNPTQAAELGCQRIRGRLSVRHDCSGANLPLLWVLLEKWVDHWLLETNSLSQSVQYVKTRSGETLKKECSSHFKAEFFNLWVATPFGVTWKV